MATSDSVNFTMNRDEIINLAGEIGGMKGIGRVMGSEDVSRMDKLLNLIVKQWMGKADFAPGLKVWTRKRAYLFPQIDQSDYVLGATDHATASYDQTTLSGAEASGQTELSVTSTSGMAVSDNIGIVMDDNTIHWSTIDSIVVDTSVTIADATNDDAASGNTVYTYTSKITMPLNMISVRRMDTSNNETPLTIMTLGQYEEGLLKKDNDGNPSRYIYERGLTTGTLRFDYQTNDTSEIIRLTYLRPIEDFDAATDSPDFPQEWFRPLVGQLAIDGAMAIGRPITESMKTYRNEALSIAGNVDPDNEVMFFQSET